LLCAASADDAKDKAEEILETFSQKIRNLESRG
jgi:hypothetical protein